MQLWYFTMLFELNRSYSVRCHGKIILNDEQLRISKEAVSVSIKVLPDILVESTRKSKYSLC